MWSAPLPAGFEKLAMENEANQRRRNILNEKKGFYHQSNNGVLAIWTISLLTFKCNLLCIST